MRLTLFRTVRGRLLALLVGIALPIAILTAITTTMTYKTVLAAIQRGQTSAADDYAVRTRVWYRGNLRSLLAAGAVIARQPSASCDRDSRQVLAETVGFRAIHIRRQDGETCSASLDPVATQAELEGAMAALAGRPATRVWAGVEMADVRYDALTIAGARYFAIYASNSDPSRPMREGLLLVAPEVLDTVFDLGEADSGFKIAFFSRLQGLLVSRGGSDQDLAWLPAQQNVSNTTSRWEAESRGAGKRSYAARMVAEPDFYVLASFDDRAEKMALVQFLILLLAPLLTIALLGIVYLRAIDTHCVRWLRGLETAARMRTTLVNARAIVADDMPTDIRSVTEAFNTMVDEQEVRQRKLQNALDDNRFLVRELHHRVKNSLQVVQSYIGLTKRDYRGDARLALSDAECRVHVLSAAYRFTLADGEMQPVRIDLFLEDVVTMISNLVRRRDQWVASRIETNASLTVDRVIPLGFLVVDVVSRALRHTPGVVVTLIVTDIDEATVEFSMEADREIDHSEPPKLFAGLVAQIEAVQTLAPAGRHLGAWRLTHRI